MCEKNYANPRQSSRIPAAVLGARVGTTWLKTVTGISPRVSPTFHPLAAQWQNIVEKELDLGIAAGTPVLVSRGYIDDRLNSYFRRAFSRDRMSTADTYAGELKTFFSYLEIRGLYWDEVSRDDVRSFQLWRVYDKRNLRRVTPATWNKGWAALRHFYTWACKENWIGHNPVGEQDRLRNSTQVGGHREKNARASRDRWLTPAEFSMWRDVGLRGYQAVMDNSGKIVAGLPTESFRGRNISRNAAFVDYILSTGLRKAEAGSLLRIEIPRAVGDKSPIVGKGGVFRHYSSMHKSGLEAVQLYVDGERQDLVAKAQKSGRYEATKDRIVVTEVLAGTRRGQRFRLESGSVVDVVAIPPADRLRLFFRVPAGLEPAALWLTDAGSPMPHATWNSVFNASNARVSAHRAALGVESPWVHVSPHSLRFTFALMFLVAGVRATDIRLSLGPADPFLAGSYSHVFDELRDLLGHASVTTTKQTYLEPAKSLRRSKIFGGGTIQEVWDGIVARSPLVGLGGPS